MRKNHTYSKFFVDILLIIILIVSTTYAWKNLPLMIIRGDGFLHFLVTEQQRFWSQKYAFTGIDVGPSIAGAILPKLFGHHIRYYIWFKVGLIVLINVLFYVCFRIITKSRLISFTAAILAGVSYYGMWGSYGHCYCFFLERIINFPFMLISFLCLHMFLTKNSKLLYALSLLLFFVGIALGHLELMMTPIFMAYPFFWYIITYGFKHIRKGIFVSLSFLMISVFIALMQRVSYGNWGWPVWTLPDFIFNQAKYNSFGAMGRHLVYLTDYFPALPYINTDRALDKFNPPRQATAIIPYLLLIYSSVFVALYTHLRKFRILLISCVSGAAGIIFLNAYIRLYELSSAGPNRYLYFPAFLLSVFWAITMWYYLFNKKACVDL